MYYDENRIILYYKKSSKSGVSFVVQNCGESTLHFIFDCSESQNVLSSSSSLIVEIVVPPKEAKLIMHLMPDDLARLWSWDYTSSYCWSDTTTII